MKKLRILEDSAFILIILLNIFDFFEMLPVEIDYFKKILSWTILGYLLYKASLTKLFFGVENKRMDLLLILTYFLFTVKNLVGYALVSLKEKSSLSEFFYFLANDKFELYAFYLAGVLLIVFSFYFVNIHVKRPSLLYVIHEGGVANTAKKKVERFIVSYLVLVAFFIIVFNLMMEWLAMAVDAPLLMAGIFLYLHIVIVLHKRFGVESMLHQVGSFGEKFYNDFIQLFHTKKRILLGFSGLLVLFLLVDVGNFIIPYIVNFHDPLYFVQLGDQEALITLILEDMVFTNVFEKISLAWIYIFNILAILFLLSMPAFIWYNVYKRKGFRVTNLSLSLFFVSVIVYLFKPVFIIEAIRIPGLVGVYIKTSNAGASLTVFILSLVVGVLVFFAAREYLVKKGLIIVSIVLLMAFFTFYISYYFYSLSLYYVSSITYLVSKDMLFLAFYHVLFLVILTLFFIGGFMIFLLEVKREFKYKKIYK